MHYASIISVNALQSVVNISRQWSVEIKRPGFLLGIMIPTRRQSFEFIKRGSAISAIQTSIILNPVFHP
jgi:hypothetical protein